jgi:CheY-like chemotaxis protein
MLESVTNVPNIVETLKPADEIFIVDDNEDYRDLLSAILSLEGYQVTSFADGVSFLKEAWSRVPLCVFLDIVMPGPSGLDILKKLTAKNYAAPVFLISARHDSPAVVEGMKNGARDFIEKPFDPYTAVLRVRDAVEFWAGGATVVAPDLPSFHSRSASGYRRWSATSWRRSWPALPMQKPPRPSVSARRRLPTIAAT